MSTPHSASRPAVPSSKAAQVEEEKLGVVWVVVFAAVIGAVGAMVLVGTHRISHEIAGIEIPTGLVFGALYQLAATWTMVWLAPRKLGLVIIAVVFGMFAMLFATTSAGGAVLMPAQIAGETQWQGWAVQLIGVIIPLIAAAFIWGRQIRSLAAKSREA